MPTLTGETDWDVLRQGAWDAFEEKLGWPREKVDALRFALYCDAKVFLRNHPPSLPAATPSVPPGSLPEPTAADGYADALHEACVWLAEHDHGQASKALHDALVGRASGAAKRATNTQIDTLHDESVRREQSLDR